MKNKERFVAEQSAIIRGYVSGQKKSSDMLKTIAVIRNKFTDPSTRAIHDNVTAKFVCKHYID